MQIQNTITIGKEKNKSMQIKFEKYE